MTRGATIRKVVVLMALVVAVVFCLDIAIAQAPAPSQVPTEPNAPKQALDLVSSRAFLLTVSLIAFGLIIIFLEFLLLRKRTTDKIDDLAKFFIITLIIIGTLVLVGAGFTGDQIAPVIGLFGTVAGYLLGRNSQGQPGAGEVRNDGANDGSTRPPANTPPPSDSTTGTSTPDPSSTTR
jgi:hypothetical protein